jgi:hypothetical protein
MKTKAQLLAALALGCTGLAAQAADPYVNVTVGGEIKPGVYGRVDIDTNPPPVVYSPQPVIIQQVPVVVVPGQVVAPVKPVYVYAPPGHRKHWAKHCARYNACNAPVYFVKVDGQGRVAPAPVAGPGNQMGEHGHSHGKGRGRDRD